MLLNVFHEWRR